MLRATSWANKPAQFTTVWASNRMGSAPPTSSSIAPFTMRPARKRAAKGYRGAVVLGLAAQSEHERVAVHDARRRRLQCRRAGELRLQRAGFARREHAQIANPVDLGLGMELFQSRDLPRIGSDNQLAAAAVRNPAFGEERIERAPARHAQPRLQRPRG